MTPSNPLPVRVYVISTHALYNLETNYYSLHSAVNLGHAGNLFKSSAQRVKPPKQTYHFGHWPTAPGIDRMRRRGCPFCSAVHVISWPITICGWSAKL